METKSEKRTRLIIIIIELIFQLSGMLIIYHYLGWGVCWGLFLLTTGLNMQNSRNAEKIMNQKLNEKK